MIAAVAVVGRPSASSGTSVPAAAALLAASGPATPSIAPRPNSSRSRARRFSSAYERNVGISAPPAGSVPSGNPIAAPRSHGFHERDHSSRVIHSEPRARTTESMALALRRGIEHLADCEQPDGDDRPRRSRRAIAEYPSVRRGTPVSGSIPITPSSRPNSRLAKPRSRDSPSTAETATNARTASEKYSAGPNRSATSMMTGANTVNAAVARVPATNDPIAAVASAAPPRPSRAIRLPSTADMTEALSPGVFNRMAVVGSAVHRAVVDAGKHDERRGRIQRVGHRQQQSHGQRRADAWQHPDHGAERHARQRPQQVVRRERDARTRRRVRSSVPIDGPIPDLRSAIHGSVIPRPRVNAT